MFLSLEGEDKTPCMNLERIIWEPCTDVAPKARGYVRSIDIAPMD